MMATAIKARTRITTTTSMASITTSRVATATETTTAMLTMMNRASIPHRPSFAAKLTFRSAYYDNQQGHYQQDGYYDDRGQQGYQDEYYNDQYYDQGGAHGGYGQNGYGFVSLSLTGIQRLTCLLQCEAPPPRPRFRGRLGDLQRLHDAVGHGSCHRHGLLRPRRRKVQQLR